MDRHPTLIGLLISFVVLTIIFRLIEFTKTRERRLPWFRRGYWTDVAYWLFTPLVTRAATGIAVAIAVGPIAFLIWGRVDRELFVHGFGPLSKIPPWEQAVMILVAGDFIGYWMHRFFHGQRFWCFHAVHHASIDLDWLSSVRVHPVNDAIMRLAAAVPLLLTGLSPLALAGIAPLLTLLAILVHANVDWDWGPLRSVIASPLFHRWHHTSEEEGLDKNFAGLLPAWDIMFGTYYMPKGKVPEMFGTKTLVPDGLTGQLAYPFRNSGNGTRTPIF